MSISKENQDQLSAVESIIQDYSELNAPSLAGGRQKYAEKLSPEQISTELKGMERAFRTIRTHIQQPDRTFFDTRLGFPTEQGNEQDRVTYHELITEDVLAKYKSWIEGSQEDGDVLLPGEKDKVTYALGDGYEIFKAYYGIKDKDPWNSTSTKISRLQSYKNEGYPHEADIQETMANLKIASETH